MFSCCPWTTEGSGLKKDKNEGQGGTLKFMILSCLQCLWPFAQKETDLTQDNQTQDYADEGEHECAPKVVTEPCRESPISADMVENMVNQLVPSLQGGDPLFAPSFLYAYRQFTTTQHVLDLLLKRFAYFRLDCEEDEQIKSVLCSFLDSWIDIYPEEFCQTGNLSILKKLKAYLTVNMPSSNLNLRVHMLLEELQEDASESERDDEDSDLGSHTSEDSEIEVLFPSVKMQPKPTCAPESESPKPNRELCSGNQM